MVNADIRIDSDAMDKLIEEIKGQRVERENALGLLLRDVQALFGLEASDEVIADVNEAREALRRASAQTEQE